MYCLESVVNSYNFSKLYILTELHYMYCASTIMNGILLPKLFWPTHSEKNCSCDREIFLKFETEGQEFAILRSLEQFVWTVKGQNNFW